MEELRRAESGLAASACVLGGMSLGKLNRMSLDNILLPGPFACGNSGN
jgi:hypothetical protein